ncbi:SusD/RagB family nutrient-binding outer membrane lipoprotein [Lacihabitans soyangensis]|uniref:SusD/RagB family nutrient-binding outer membrane lipoprotein n=2 Tax=Lacihabitans soyangensis TaxID=869394 RepID=A0AAE3KRZ7_9BACT|nr:SusD/RagB family nutrient-binding outer membrane lipoprotein [Lacihabitans soyangensis]
MKRKIYTLLMALGVFLVSSCELEYLENPNLVTEASTDADFLLNNIQLNFRNVFNGVSDSGQRLTRMLNQGANTYETAYTPTSYDGLWEDSYAGLLADAKVLKKIAADKGFKRHAGIAKTLEAFTLIMLVDAFGSIPYSEALNPSNFNPKADDGAAVYAAALELLKSAKTDFSGTATGTPNDYYYANNYTRWTKLVNTLMLKYHLNRRLIDKAGSTSAIAALITENQLIGVGDEFTFKYGVSASDPDSRHPDYSAQAQAGGGDYQSTFFMWHLTEAKGFDDPRAKYYFYRQVGVNTTTSSEMDCISQFKPSHYPEDMVFCLPGERGYWGRDHLDNDGIPPDALKRTLYGVYPAGYRFDNNTPAAAGTADMATNGAGILPIMLPAYVDFMLAEAAITLGTAGDAKALVTSGITKSINFVRSWSLTTNQQAKINAFESATTFETNRNKYVTTVAAQYDAATTESAKLNIMGREYWIALYGNGVEAYNLYRRTGKPSGMQPGLNPAVGNFPRSFIYPSVYVNTNSTAKQKADFKVKVFWDNNPDGFIF